jgi:hypothetical protein
MAETISACFEGADEAISAMRELRKQGFPASAVTLTSSEPIHAAIDPASDKARSRVPAFCIGGGLIGAAGALLLTIWTARRVGLVVGGMPIVTPWAFGIIVFEMIALGAILATVARMIYEGGLMRRATSPKHDDLLAAGNSVLTVECASEESRRQAEAVLTLTSGKIVSPG